MVVIGDSLLIVIIELGFSFYSFIIQDNEKFSLITRLTSTLSVCFFLHLSFFIKPLHYLEQRRAEEVIVIAIFCSFSGVRTESHPCRIHLNLNKNLTELNFKKISQI